MLAGDKLRIYKVPDAEIDPLLKGLSDADRGHRQFGNVEDKAKMTLLSQADGIVIEREVVPGNFYETSSVLMVIAPLDHLWVLVNVYELDQDKVAWARRWRSSSPSWSSQSRARSSTSPTRSRRTPAPSRSGPRSTTRGRLKADMVVKAMLDIPPIPGQTVIPRIVDGLDQRP